MKELAPNELFGKVMKFFRQRKKLRLEDVAYHLKSTVGTVQAWEAGKRGIKLDRVAEMMKLYGITYLDFAKKVEKIKKEYE